METQSIDISCMVLMRRRQPFSVFDQRHTFVGGSPKLCACVCVFHQAPSLGNDSVSLKWNPGLVRCSYSLSCATNKLFIFAITHITVMATL